MYYSEVDVKKDFLSKWGFKHNSIRTYIQSNKDIHAGCFLQFACPLTGNN